MNRGEAYTAAGKRRSSMTHARRGHQCQFCEKVSFGNGGKVAHARAHVRRGEAVEIEKFYSMGLISRFFLPASDTTRIERFLAEGFHRIGDQR